MSARHEPVLLAETLAWLRNGPGLYLDATLGDGGHAEALLDLEPGARLLGCDRDRDALDVAGARLARFEGRVILAHATFADLPTACRRAGGELLAGALFDLGLSSRQIDDPARGISFSKSGPLDLRLDQSRGATASERIAEATEDELEAVLRAYGDLRESRRLARAIADAAHTGALTSTDALRAVIDRAFGGRSHPRRYAQVFQAFRIWVNGEADDLDAALAWLPEAIRPGGMVVTLAYHSGEDRKIKQAMRGPSPRTPSRRLPPVEAERPPEGSWESVTRHVVTPSHAETARNPRARSARLRAFRRKSR